MLHVDIFVVIKLGIDWKVTHVEAVFALAADDWIVRDLYARGRLRLIHVREVRRRALQIHVVLHH